MLYCPARWPPGTSLRDSEALLRQVLAHPDLDGPRLIFADWLEDRGHPRGEFIRAQCALAQLQRADARRAELQTRADELLKEHQLEWIGQLKGLVTGWPFQPGFVDSAVVAPKPFLSYP